MEIQLKYIDSIALSTRGWIRPNDSLAESEGFYGASPLEICHEVASADFCRVFGGRFVVRTVPGTSPEAYSFQDSLVARLFSSSGINGFSSSSFVFRESCPCLTTSSPACFKNSLYFSTTGLVSGLSDSRSG